MHNTSSALEAAELSKEELSKSEGLASSFLQVLSGKNTIVEKFGEVLSGTNESARASDLDFAETVALEPDGAEEALLASEFDLKQSK